MRDRVTQQLGEPSRAGHGSGHGRLVTTCHHAMLRTERERFDQSFVARHGSIAPAPTKKYVKHQAFKKK